ncbi:hypothetical protein [Pararcticibacter amylolyticus]|nr:hypothetical protein [Pararcticibacter amylolyticus]
MKKCFLIMLLPVLFSCNNPAGKSAAGSGTTDSAEINGKISPGQLIIPGEGIAHLTIGLPVDSAVARLGRPDSSDAAMGSALMAWYSKDANRYRTAIFARRNMGNEDVSRIKMIMVNSPWFKTKDGISTGTALAAIEKNYSLKHVDNASTRQKRVQVFDDINNGIAFDIDSGSKKCIAITVHAAGDSSGTYINMR